MNAITDLNRLLGEMTPILHPEYWVYCTIDLADMTAELMADSFAIIRESESITLITSPERARSLGTSGSETSGLEISVSGAQEPTLFRRIELRVYSSLEAVGLTAAVSQCLKEHNISANVIAAFHHDHILLPQEDAAEALQALQTLSSKHQLCS